jgi:sterol carrier protein 2
MTRKVNVIGVGMVPFAKPGESEEYNVMASKAGRAALEDAKVPFGEVQQAFAGYVFGDSTCGQRAVYEIGLTGIPVFNVNNNCSTGSSALMLAAQAVAGGLAECVLAVGFEQMEKGALSAKWTDRTNPLDKHANLMSEVQGFNQAPPAAQMFGGAGREYRWKHGTKRETFAKISAKARQHASKNPYALFKNVLSVEEVMASPEVFDPLTRYQCCPPTCGAAAAVLCSDEFAKKHGISQPRLHRGPGHDDRLPVELRGEVDDQDGRLRHGQERGAKVYEQTGIGPQDVQVVELHDCFTANELLTYEALGLCKEGEAEKFIWDGDNTYGGKFVTNPSGGLLSKGHPLGATGLAQCTELVWHLRGTAGRAAGGRRQGRAAAQPRPRRG